MIVEALLSLVANVLAFLLGLLPGYEFTGSADFSQLFSGGPGALLAQWIDLGAMFTAITAVLAAFFAAASIKAVRILISHITGGGGSAA